MRSYFIDVKLATTRASTTDLGRVEIFDNNTSEGRICVRVLWYVFLSTLTQIPPPEIVTVRIQSSSKSVVLALVVASFTSINNYSFLNQVTFFLFRSLTLYPLKRFQKSH